MSKNLMLSEKWKMENAHAENNVIYFEQMNFVFIM